MYKLKKNSWHYRFFKFITRIEPSTFKTMCPYFWTYVLIVFFLPLVLIIKLFIYLNELSNKASKERRKRNRSRIIELLRKKYPDVSVITNKEAYKLYTSKCFYQYILDAFDWDEYNIIRDKKNQYLQEEMRIKEIPKPSKSFQEVYNRAKDTKLFNYSAYIISIGFILGVISLIIYGATLINYTTFWIYVKATLIVILILAIIASIVFGLSYLLSKIDLKCLFTRDSKSLKAINYTYKYTLKWMLVTPLVFIFKFFKLILNMIYSVYKKQCPLINWEEQ